MRQHAKVKAASGLYEVIPIEEMTPAERSDGELAPSAVWTAWVLLALVLIGLAIWSTGPDAYDLSIDITGTPPPELIGP